MPTTLHIARYAKTPLSNPEVLEYIENPADVGVRWALPGGLQKLTVRVKARNAYDRFDRYQNHHGQRIAVFDSYFDSAICVGFIYEIRLLENGVEYICAGPWQRHKQSLDTTIYSKLTAISEVLRDVLTNHVEVANIDKSLVTDNLTAIDGWQPNLRGGRYPADIINDLLLMSDGTGNRYDYHLRPFTKGVRLEKHRAVYEVRDPDAPADWVVSVNDLRSLDLSRNIWNLTTSATVFHGFISGVVTATPGDNATVIDNVAFFETAGVRVGDSFYNITNNEEATITGVTQPILNIQATPTINSINDIYSIQLQTGSASVSATPATVDFWAVERSEQQGRLTATQATQYAQALVDDFSVPVQQQAFVVTSPRITSADGVKWPLWELIKRGGGSIRIKDINPIANQFSATFDELVSYKIVALDYKLSSNSLRCALSNEDNRIDTILQKAVSNQTQIVSVEQ